jgi:hypothetical protein
MAARDAQDLIGIWTLASVEIPLEGGDVERPFGENPTGTILYLENGTMAVHVAGSGDAADRLRAYAGPWHMEGSRVVHEVEVSVEPELRGVRLERGAELEGDRLTYRTVEAQGPGRVIVVWERVS